MKKEDGATILKIPKDALENLPQGVWLKYGIFIKLDKKGISGVAAQSLTSTGRSRLSHIIPTEISFNDKNVDK